MFTVEQVILQRKGIDPLYTTEIDSVVPGKPGCFMEGIDAAAATKIVLCRHGAKLIETQCALLRLNLELLQWYCLGSHHCSLAGTNRAVAPKSLFDLVTLE